MDHHLACVGGLAALHVAVPRLVHPLRKPRETYWCAIHAIVNVAVMYVAWPSLWALLGGDAEAAAPHADRRAAVALAMWLHVYHAVFYSLSPDDRMHHTLFVAVLGTPSYVYASHATNAVLYFLSGLPGALIYGLIVAQRCGRLLGWSEPRVSAAVNLGLRMPGVLACTAAYASRLHRDVPRTVVAMQLALPLINVVYYATQSYARARRA